MMTTAILGAAVGVLIVIAGYVLFAALGLPFMLSLIITIPTAFLTGVWLGYTRTAR